MPDQNFEASLASLEQMLSFINQQGISRKIPSDLMNKILVACEEVIVNVIHYAYEDQPGWIDIVFQDSHQLHQIEIWVIDEGIPFDPTEKEILSCPESGQLGGFGIHLCRQIMDSIRYERKENKNILKLMKHMR